MSTILCYGDSNTHGTKPLTQLGQFERYAPEDRWPDVMASALGADHTVISEGLPGRTTVHDDPIEGGMRNGLTVLPAILHSHTPIDVMLLMLGTNDLKHRFSVTSYEIARSLERLVQFARGEGVVQDIVLIAPPSVLETGILADVFAGAEARQSALVSHVAAAADRQDCGFVDAGSIVEVSAIDGVHWEAAAQQTFGAAMAGIVKDRL